MPSVLLEPDLAVRTAEPNITPVFKVEKRATFKTIFPVRKKEVQNFGGNFVVCVLCCLLGRLISLSKFHSQPEERAKGLDLPCHQNARSARGFSILKKLFSEALVPTSEIPGYSRSEKNKTLFKFSAQPSVIIC